MATNRIPSRDAAFRVLDRVIHGGAFSNLALQAALEKHNLRPSARGNTTYLVYGVLRNLTLLDEVFRARTRKGRLDASAAVLLMARLAVYEILFQKKVPEYATISNYVTMASKKCSSAEAKFLNACLRRIKKTDVDHLLNKEKDPIRRCALEFSHPEWFVRTVFQTYGEGPGIKMLRANNIGMPTYYRVNTTRTSTQEILDLFHSLQLDVNAAPAPEGCIYVKSGQGYYPQREYEAGALTPQDLSTQIVAHVAAPQPGEQVLDLCCGRGTKSTHLAELMNNSGRVVAVDRFDHKIELLKKDARRLGLTIIEPRAADILGAKDLGEFDCVLLDAPCTGTGTVRRRPEIKHRLRPEDVVEMAALQRRLLSAAAACVRPGGRLVYATCSVLRDENDDVIEWFLENHPEFELDRAAMANGNVPCERTPFSRVFLPHQTRACAMAVSALIRSRTDC